VRLINRGPGTGLRTVGDAVEQRLADLGITRRVQFSIVDGLEAGQIQVQVNDRLGPPIPVARPGEVAVQAPPTALRGCVWR
jgi:hypothetical protein